MSKKEKKPLDLLAAFGKKNKKQPAPEKSDDSSELVDAFEDYQSAKGSEAKAEALAAFIQVAMND